VVFVEIARVRQLVYIPLMSASDADVLVQVRVAQGVVWLHALRGRLSLLRDGSVIILALNVRRLL